MGISLPSIIQAISPLLVPSGNNNGIGPGGVQQVPPNQWNPRFDLEQPPAQVPDANAIFDYVEDQEVNNSRNSAQSEADQISNVNFGSELDSIIERNKKALGLNGGANGFYDVNLVSSASGNSGFSEADEPDGFRLYLICPPKPGVSVALAAVGDGIGVAGDTIKDGADALANKARENKGTIDVVTGEGSAEKAAQLSEDAGTKAKQVSDAIKNYMHEAGQDFDKKFDEYVKNAYDGDASQGNAFYSVVLPMPKELVDTHQHQTDNLMLGLLPRAASMLGIGFETFSSGLSKKYDQRKARQGGFLSGLGELGGAAVGGVVGGLQEVGAYAYDNARARVGFGLNPNVETVYAAPAPRQFQFTFELYIKSEKEAIKVKDFIQRLKQHSYPLSVLSIGGQSQLYLYPGEVYFEFSGRYRNNLFRSLRPCLMTNIQVNYSNGDQYQHFSDGGSIVYVVSITLLENRLLDRNILVDDADPNKMGNKTTGRFSNSEFRKDVRFRDTLLGENVEEIITNPNRTFDRLTQSGEFSPNFVGPPTP